MRNKFSFFYKKPKYYKKSSNDRFIENRFIVIGNRTIFKDITVQIRETSLKKTYLKVGSDSLLYGKFIFENEKGYIEIGDRTFIGGGNYISINNIKIGNDVLVSWGCTFIDNDAHSLSWQYRKTDVLDWKKGIEEGKLGFYKNWNLVSSLPIVIKDKAWIGFESVLLKGVTIGEGAIVGARSVVTKDVPDWTVVAGNPAKVVRVIPEEDR